GNQWAQATESGQADAGLAWEGLRAQWAGQGLKLKYLIGTKFSKQPSNVYSVRASDLSDKAKVDLYTRFLQGMIMGLEFAMPYPLAGHTNSYHTYSFDEALAGIAGAGYKGVELSAVPGWTEHVDLDADPASVREKLEGYGLEAVSLSGHSDLTTRDGLAH